MNIGIIVYSQTGHTLFTANKIAKRLGALGHNAQVERVKVVGEVKPNTPVNLEHIPDISGYDALLFGGPVHGFQLCAPCTALLIRIAPMDGKPCACFVTKQMFTKAWGGKRSTEKLRSLAQAKGGRVCTTEIFNWKNPDKEALMDAFAEEFARNLG